jgi:polyisoprenoid-binding protein YceI
MPMKMMLSVVLFVVAAAVAVAGYTMFKPPAQATAPIEAAPVSQGGAANASAASAAPVFELDPNASSARFVINEILRGSPYTVVGTTNQVAGQIAADLDDLDRAQVGTIRINARTLTTDADGRNRMLKNQILQTDEHEYITFTPKQMLGLPETVQVGQSFTFQMVGDLAIRGTARETRFDVVVTPTAENRLEGTASSTIRYADWGVSIPQVPSVAGVADQVALHLDFVAIDS